MADMPMLGIASRGNAVGFFFLEHFDVEALQEVTRLVPLEEGDAGPSAPGIAHAVPLAAEPSTLRKGFADSSPQVSKLLGLAQRHREARIDEPHTERQR